MDEANPQIAYRQHFGFRKARVVRRHGALPAAKVAVAPDGHDGGDFLEPVDHLRDHEVPGVHDEVDAVKRLKDLRPQLFGRGGYVGVRDKADAHGYMIGDRNKE